ncbi:hypothetical protein EAI_11136 [Harpegnathos saltator]|uniref:Uncharacterized protein n=1 Tax=Harpegnathos saltator TaxID=610380 RepID=E2BTL0_HARSA|nr:hypothetical protein EAI_11136 [Harpegnathos saltator]
MNSSVKIMDREKVTEEIAKTSESIRKKYRALKTGRMVENAALERHFKPIIEPLKQIAGSSANVESNDVKTETSLMSTSVETKSVILKPEKKIKHKAKLSPVALTPLKRKLFKDPPIVSTSTEALQYEEPYESSLIDNLLTDDDDENVSEIPDEPVVTSVRRQLRAYKQTLHDRDHFDPLGQKYMGAVLSSEKDNAIDYVYGVRFSNDGA